VRAMNHEHRYQETRKTNPNCQTVQALEVRLRLLRRAWKMRRDHPITTEVELAVICSQVRFVVGAIAVFVIAVITDWCNRAPSLRFPEQY